MTTTKHQTSAQKLKAELKASGIRHHQISVREQHETIRVLVKDPAVDLERLRAIAKGYERVRRDQATGEILLGGNTYLDVEYTTEALAPTVARILPILSDLPADGTCIEVLDGEFRVFRVDDDYFYVSDKSGHDLGRFWGGAFAARSIAEAHCCRAGSSQAGTVGQAEVR